MHQLSVTVDGYTFDIQLERPANGALQVTVWVDGQEYAVIGPDLGAPWSEMEWFIIANRPYEVMIDPNLDWIRSSWGIHSLEIQDQEAALPRPASGDGRVKAPIPGQITQVLVSQEDEVELGQPLLVLEAMKMENEIRAPCTGRIKQLNVIPGQRVKLDEVLAEIE